MSTKTKVWLIIAASLVLLGCILFACAMTTLGWDFSKLSTHKYETNEYEISEEFSSISIYTETARVTFVTSDDKKCRVVYYEQENARHAVSVKDGNLVIKRSDDRKWYDYIGIGFELPKITVYVPSGEHGALSVRTSTGDVMIPEDLSFASIDISGSTCNVTSYASASGAVKIKLSTGDIKLKSISAGDIEVSVSTGDVCLSDVACKSLISSGSTGDIELESVIVENKLSIERSTGDIELEGCDAAEIRIKTDTGDIEGSLLTEKLFVTDTDTGEVEVPKSQSGGRCEIITDTGDIEIVYTN